MDKHLYFKVKRKRKDCKESCTYTRYCSWRRYCCQLVITDMAVCNFCIYVDTKRKDQVSNEGESVNITFTYSNYFIFQYSLLPYLVYDV